MKKKILTMCLVAALAATAIVGGTLAYFTDTDEATNEFTIGNVKIDLIEDFPKDAEDRILKPGDSKTNAINKDVWIQNVGSESAWLWYEWYIPSVLDTTDRTTGTNNIVHVNSKGATWDTYWNNAKYAGFQDIKFKGTITEATTWDHNPEDELTVKGVALDQNGPEGYIGTVTIDGVEYNKYLVLYKSIVEPGKYTPQAMDQVYLDSRVDYDGTNYTFDGDVINYDFTKGVDIIVKAYGIQSAGFDTVYDAYIAYQAQANN